MERPGEGPGPDNKTRMTKFPWGLLAEGCGESRVRQRVVGGKTEGEITHADKYDDLYV
jgi:hypothetical protein